MKFSVVVPTYNRAHCLRRALDSVLAQTLVPNDIVLVDDGSTDETLALMRADYPNVRVLSQHRAGVSAARNAGISATESQWVALLDSDDTWHPKKLATIADCIAESPSCRLWHSNERWLRNGKELGQKTYHRKRGGWIFEYCLPRCVISPSAAVVHKSLFIEHGGFDPSLPACEDYDLWLRICAREAVGYCDEVLVIKHGGHDDQLSATIPALDRWRIHALNKLLESSALSIEQRRQTIDTLRKKIAIYAAGARKRGLNEQLQWCEEILCRLA